MSCKGWTGPVAATVPAGIHGSGRLRLLTGGGTDGGRIGLLEGGSGGSDVSGIHDGAGAVDTSGDSGGNGTGPSSLYSGGGCEVNWLGVVRDNNGVAGGTESVGVGGVELGGGSLDIGGVANGHDLTVNASTDGGGNGTGPLQGGGRDGIYVVNRGSYVRGSVVEGAVLGGDGVEGMSGSCCDHMGDGIVRGGSCCSSLGVP